MCSSAFGWGRTGHQIINGRFEKFLPVPLQSFSAKSSYYIAHASDADMRKGSDPSESPKHFIDIDYYPEFSGGTLSHNYDTLCVRYGKATVIDKGTLPWAISSAYGMLVVYMENHDWGKADSVIADLGHYVGDAFQPLHCTQNYDGAMTGNRGIHSRFESSLLDDYQGDIKTDAGTASALGTTALEFAFRVIGQSNSKVGAILDADNYAKGIDPSYGSAYYSAMWSKLDTLMNEQLESASESLASLVYSAWLDAGSPSLTGVASIPVPSVYQVSSVYPNPFNPVASIEITVPLNSGRSSAIVSIYSVEGRLIRQEDRELSPGRNVVSFDFSRLSSGVYFIRVSEKGSSRRPVAARRAVLLK